MDRARGLVGWWIVAAASCAALGPLGCEKTAPVPAEETPESPELVAPLTFDVKREPIKALPLPGEDGAAAPTPEAAPTPSADPAEDPANDEGAAPDDGAAGEGDPDGEGDQAAARDETDDAPPPPPPEEEAAPEPDPEPEPNPNPADGDLELLDAVMASGLNKRKPIGKGTRFPSNVRRLWAWVRVRNRGSAPTEITAVWTYEGEVRNKTTMNVGVSKSWRTWSYHSIGRKQVGDWTVTLVGPSGGELKTLNFKVEDRAAPPKALDE